MKLASGDAAMQFYITAGYDGGSFHGSSNIYIPAGLYFKPRQHHALDDQIVGNLYIAGRTVDVFLDIERFVHMYFIAGKIDLTIYF
ncbi:hypothetical protein SDC9_208056 [bioreactor metagenome]|uniref:Uncharacterized protein n=1 Tax=bioreactor metagenome TaxID=1076179 RepID=A0A645J9J4_9ZZZZ